MFDLVLDDVLPEKTVLLRAMVGNTTRLELRRVDLPEIETDPLADLDRCTECEAIEVAQALSLDLEPVPVVA